MEEARRKLRVCLICVVMAAVIVGIIYYVGAVNTEKQVNDGTLVRTEKLQEAKETFALTEGARGVSHE